MNRSCLKRTVVCFVWSLVSSYQAFGDTGLEDGYVLIAPLGDSNAYLINDDKKIVHRWDCGSGPGNSTYMLDDGSLLRTAKEDNGQFQARGGSGGRLKRIAWDGQVMWDYVVSDESIHAHHDVEPLPNGNVLVIAWERHSRIEAISAGRAPSTLADDALWAETILELKPVGVSAAEVVWRWRLWDHLIQEHDQSKRNYGSVADHPELVDINYAIRRGGADWIHMNSIDYNQELDQILLSARWFDEAWIIDHSTTTAEARGSSGGKSGMGGDLLYRWGNPESYFAGFASDRQFFAQHDIRWIDPGLPGAGNLLLFNNGDQRSERGYSSVDEFTPPLNAKSGLYHLPETAAFPPQTFAWTYRDESAFMSDKISGAQRLRNGNTLVCSGSQSWVFVVNEMGDRVWELPLSDLSFGERPLRGGLFRAPFYAKEHPAFQGRDMSELSAAEE